MLRVHCHCRLPFFCRRLCNVAVHWDYPTNIVLELGSFRGVIEC